ncbi:MAG: 16S rRNA (guanine(527)-N(7))-methyltransferase RsmG [Nitratireductor sp.]
MVSANEITDLAAIYPVSRETISRLEVYEALLRQWQSKTNLVAPGTLEAFWSRHVADSLQCLKIVPGARNWIDLGSGGGFPALPIAIARSCDSPETFGRHVLIESNHKKCAFLREVARKTGTPCIVMNERIESATKQLQGERFDVVTARALAPLPKLLDLAAPLLRSGVVALFHKGRDFRAELEDCRGLWSFDLVIHKSRIESGSVLLEIRNPVSERARDAGAVS